MNDTPHLQTGFSPHYPYSYDISGCTWPCHCFILDNFCQGVEKIFHIFFNRQPIKKVASCFRGGKENKKIKLAGDRKKYFLMSGTERKVTIIYIYAWKVSLHKCWLRWCKIDLIVLPNLRFKMSCRVLQELSMLMEKLASNSLRLSLVTWMGRACVLARWTVQPRNAHHTQNLSSAGLVHCTHPVVTYRSKLGWIQ